MLRIWDLIPATSWLPSYELGNLRWDLIAGITLAFFVMPESLANASLAGLPPQYGIYCCLAGGLIFALFTTSRQIAVGPTSAISLMIGSTVAGMAGGDPARWLAIAELTALTVGVLCIAAFVLRLSAAVSFVSTTILIGFKAGAALSIASTQLPKLFGVEGTRGHFFERIAHLLQQLPETNVTTLMFGAAAFALLIIGMKLLPGKPVSLVVLIASIIIVSMTPLATNGLHLVGFIPSGLPEVGRPSLRLADVDGIVGLALACFLMGYIETVSAARAFGQKHNYTVNPRQELLSLGMANISSALASGYVVAGGLSQSTVNDKAGARTPLALIICSIALAVLLFFTDLLANLPEVVLAAIVLDAVLGLIKVKEMRRLWTLSKVEFGVAMVALVSVLTFGILQGVLIAAVVSIGLLLARTATPNVAVLGRVGDTEVFTDVARHPDNTVYDGLLILRVESSFFYFNVDHIATQIATHLAAALQPVRMVILNMSAAPYVDVAGSTMLLELADQLERDGIALRIVDARAHVRETLRKQGMEEHVGSIDRAVSCDDVVRQYLNSL
jgi:high affinity sulfate transporter 1